MTQIRVLFICHGNICRSAAAKMVMRQMIRERNLEGRLAAESAATSSEETGNDVYPPMKQALRRRGYACEAHAARKTVPQDYGRYDLIVGMDGENLRNMRRIYGGDPEGKISLLRSWAGEPGKEIDDPWYTRDFDGALREIEAGCRGLLEELTKGQERRSGGEDVEPGKEVQVAVLSDTHGVLRRDVVEKVQECTHILHAGDIVRETDLDELRLYGSIYAVRGNNDYWTDGLRDLKGILRFEIAGVKFLMTHDRRDVPGNLEGVQAVIFGHTHQYSEEWIDGRLWLNPGSCGRARWGAEVTMARLTLRNGKIRKVTRIDFPE